MAGNCLPRCRGPDRGSVCFKHADLARHAQGSQQHQSFSLTETLRFSSHCLSIRLPLMPLFWFSLPAHASVRFCPSPSPVLRLWLDNVSLSLDLFVSVSSFFLCTTLVLMALPWGGLPDASRQEHPAEPPEAEEVLPRPKRRRTSSAAKPPAAPKAPAPAAPKAPGPSASQARKLVCSRTYHAQRKLLLRAGQSPEAAARDAAAAARAAAAAVAGPQ